MRRRKSLTKKWFLTTISVIFVFTLLGIKAEAEEAGTEKKIPESPEIVEQGKKVYEKKCINCHGEKGDAEAPATLRLDPQPMDFTMAFFKMKTTPGEELPTEEDIYNTINRGMPGTSMPGWSEHTPEEKWGLVYYIKSFSEQFAAAKAEGKYPTASIKVGSPIASSAESIKKGAEIFIELGCDGCHGEAGRGDGTFAVDMENEKGVHIPPRDLTRKWTFRRGDTPQAVYHTVRIGVPGTPMSSFAEELDNPEEAKEKISGEERTWHLVNYVMSLSSAKKPETLQAYKVKFIEGALPEHPDDEQWKDVPSNEYPLVGQIVIKPRMFTPKVSFVQLKALHNYEEVVFLLTWHDLSEMTQTDPEEETFADGVALQLPQKSGGQRPFFLSGDGDNPAYLMQWSADNSESITEINAKGMHKVVAQEDGKQNAKGVVAFDKGEYRLLIKRPLKTDDEMDAQLEPGKFTPVAFSAWEGSNGETETKRSISAWYFIILEAQIPNTVYYYPLFAIFAVAAFEVFIVRRVRKNKKS